MNEVLTKENKRLTTRKMGVGVSIAISIIILIYTGYYVSIPAVAYSWDTDKGMVSVVRKSPQVERLSSLMWLVPIAKVDAVFRGENILLLSKNGDYILLFCYHGRDHLIK